MLPWPTLSYPTLLFCFTERIGEREMKPIDLRRLRIDLCGKDKIPPEFGRLFEGEVLWEEGWVREWEGVGGGNRKVRVFVRCPKCGKFVPAGRITQHFGTGSCIGGRTR